MHEEQPCFFENCININNKFDIAVKLKKLIHSVQKILVTPVFQIFLPSKYFQMKNPHVTFTPNE